MKWIKVEDKRPKPCEDILFTDGEKVYKGWLETHEFGENAVFYNDTHDVLNVEHWPEEVTHWMPLPDVPKETTDVLAL